MILLEGAPFPGQSFDTVIERLEDAVLVGCPADATIEVEIVALSLASSEPITVTFNGGQDPEQYDIRLCLSDIPQDVGSMNIHQNCPDGGTFDSLIPVSAKFVFTPVGGGPGLTFDTGVEGLFPQPITGTNTGWTHVAAPGSGFIELPNGVQVDANCDGMVGPETTAPTSNFAPGIRPPACECDTPPGGGNPCQIVEFTEEQLNDSGGRHNVKPPGMEEINCCCPNGGCRQVATVRACINSPNDPDEPGVNGDVLAGDGGSCTDSIGDCQLSGTCFNTSECCCLLRGGTWTEGTNCDPLKCAIVAVCGNGKLEPGEQCDGDAGGCPGKCVDCECVGEAPTLPVLSLVGLGVLLSAGGVVIFKKRRARGG